MFFKVLTLGRTALACSDQSAKEVVRPDYDGQAIAHYQVVLPFLTEEEKSDLIQAFHDAITDTSKMYGDHPGWIYSWIASRDRHASPVLQQMEFLWRLRKLLRTTSRDGFRISCADMAMHLSIEELAVEEGWLVSHGIFDWFFIPVITGWVLFLSVLRLIKGTVRHIREAWLFRREQSPLCQEKFSVLLVSILDNGVVANPNPYRDTYFGSLPEMLIKRGDQCLVTGPVMGDARVIAQAAKRSSVPMIASSAVLTMRCFATLFARALLCWVSLLRQRPVLSCGMGIAHLFKRDLDGSLPNLFFCLLIEESVARLLAQNPQARLISVFENHPWNIAVFRAARRLQSGKQTVGFMHCAVLPSHLKNYVSTAEFNYRPQPDKIVCLGDKARDIYVTHGRRDPKTVVAGIDLRCSRLTDVVPRQVPPKKIRRLLVLLQGLAEMSRLVRFLNDAAEVMPNLRFSLRAHPCQMPLAKLAAISGVPIGLEQRLVPSTGASLKEDLDDADVVIYKGTTAVFSAVYAGIPAIHFDDGWLNTDDPLFEIDVLKTVVRRVSDLKHACCQFEQMNQDAFDAQLLAVRSYIDAYLGEPSAKGMESFLECKCDI